MDEILQRPPTEISGAARASNTIAPIFAGRRLSRRFLRLTGWQSSLGAEFLIEAIGTAGDPAVVYRAEKFPTSAAIRRCRAIVRSSSVKATLDSRDD